MKEKIGERDESMLYVLAVIHNKILAESASCRSLLPQGSQDLRVLIYDNSDADFGVRAACEENGWTYLGGNGNKGLPAAYNAALDHLKSEKAEGFLCLLDDDTRLDNTFCSDMLSHAKSTGADILLPVMKTGGRILSPWRKKGRKYFRSYEECAAEPAVNLLAFNSGMTASLAVFSDYRYDENLFLDCVDISFLTEMKKRGKKIAVVPVYGEQGFSALERPSMEAALKRFAIYKKDMVTCYGENDLACRAQLLKRAAHLAMIYRSAKPFSALRGNTK